MIAVVETDDGQRYEREVLEGESWERVTHELSQRLRPGPDGALRYCAFKEEKVLTPRLTYSTKET